MLDIALGIASKLQAFAAQVNASHMSQWKEMGLFDTDVEGWGEAFEQVVTRTLAAGGRIHFDLTGLDVAEALAGDPSLWVGRYTAWELQQVIRNKTWLGATSFYREGVLVGAEELAAVGIVVP